MRTLKLFASGSATGNAVANVVIPVTTRIRLVQFNLIIDSITDSMNMRLEVSRSSASEIATNGAQQSICEISASGNFVTSGLAQPTSNGFTPCDIPMVQGQIVYLHASITGTAVYAATFILHYS